MKLEDLKALAAALRRVNPGAEYPTAAFMWERCVDSVAAACAKQDNRVDIEQFKKACTGDDL